MTSREIPYTDAASNQQLKLTWHSAWLSRAPFQAAYLRRYPEKEMTIEPLGELQREPDIEDWLVSGYVPIPYLDGESLQFIVVSFPMLQGLWLSPHCFVHAGQGYGVIKKGVSVCFSGFVQGSS